MKPNEESEHAKATMLVGNRVQTCGAGEVGIDNFLCVGVEVYKHTQDELPSCNSVSLGA